MIGGVEIVGAGLAGCCLAWQLQMRGVKVRLLDDQRDGAASRVAAGLINPVTGKNYEPSWRIAEFLPEANAFFARVESEMGRQLWFPLPVVRWVSEKDWPKVSGKLKKPEIRRWVDHTEQNPMGWRAGVVLRGGGRLDVRAFCEATQEKFADSGEWQAQARVYCDGAFGLMLGRMGEHRSAKGEILTVSIPSWDESRIQVGAGGWLVPLGGGLFKAGATYEWDQLDGTPTESGRERVEGIMRGLGIQNFKVVAHEAGIRPIVRRSMPLIGQVGDEIVFNGLGSKGSLYAPGVARRLAEWLVDGTAIETELDVAAWLDR